MLDFETTVQVTKISLRSLCSHENCYCTETVKERFQTLEDFQGAFLESFLMLGFIILPVWFMCLTTVT